MKHRYRVYIIDLKKSVMKKSRFKKMNPDYIPNKPCVYVGSTANSVEKRFAQHLEGVRSNAFAREFGKRLRYSDMQDIRPRKTRASIEQKEAEVARELRKRGWGVWSN